MSVYASLAARMLYTWCDLYSQQLASGQDYSELAPTYGIWLLAKNLVADDRYAHDYKPRDRRGGSLVEHGGIFVFELAKLPDAEVINESERWLKFFKVGETLDDEALPEWMNTDEMRQAMGTIRQFSEKDREYHAYQARQNYLREQRAIQAELEETRRAREEARRAAEEARRNAEEARRNEEEARQGEAQAVHEKEQALREKEAALAEIERLKARLRENDGR